MTVLIDSDFLIEVSRGRDVPGVPVTGIKQVRCDGFNLARDCRRTLCGGSAVHAMVCDYLRRYRKSHSVELGDALIAATAVANGAMLWTRNRKHYPMKELTFYS